MKDSDGRVDFEASLDSGRPMYLSLSPCLTFTQETAHSSDIMFWRLLAARTPPDLNVAFQLFNLHGEIRMVGVILSHVAAGLVQHGEEGAQAAQACQVHDVFQLEGMLQGLGDQAIGCEVWLHNCCCISLNLKERTKMYNNHFKMLEEVSIWEAHAGRL